MASSITRLAKPMRPSLGLMNWMFTSDIFITFSLLFTIDLQEKFKETEQAEGTLIQLLVGIIGSMIPDGLPNFFKTVLHAPDYGMTENCGVFQIRKGFSDWAMGLGYHPVKPS